MNRKLVSNALTGIDEELIAEAMEFRTAERSRIPERNKKMKKKHLENHPVVVRRGIALALAACLVLALAATAYALNLFGLRELYANPNRGEMPQEAQAMIETGWLKFQGGADSVTQYNFAGLGTVGDGNHGNVFPDVRTGIRAQVQHLKAYACKDPLVNECVDQRFDMIPRGCAPYVQWLGIQENPAGIGWAAGKGYGDKIMNMIMKIRSI